jgi:hypothetical protein
LARINITARAAGTDKLAPLPQPKNSIKRF